MAERRMLHRKASVSTDLDDLRRKHGAGALAFWLLMIAHMDRWGCVPDDAVKLRAMVVPMWDDVDAGDIRRWTGWMVRRGMLERVTGSGGDKGLRAPDFHDHQRGTEFQKESPSPYEPAEISKRWVRDGRKPKAGDLQGGRRPVADQVATRSVRREEKGKTPSSSPTQKQKARGRAAASPDPSPGAQAQPPDADSTNGKRHHEDLAPALETLSPELRELTERGQRAAAAREAGA